MNKKSESKLNGFEFITHITQANEYLTSKETTINTKSEIQKNLQLFTGDSKETVRKNFSIFERLLYIYSFYNFSEPSQNFKSYDPNTALGEIFPSSSDAFTFEEYSLPDEFILIIKIAFNYLHSSKFLSCTNPLDNGYFGYLFHEAAYRNASFKWNISLNFMPIFSALVSTIDHFHNNFRKKQYFSSKEFFDYFKNLFKQNDSSTYVVFNDSVRINNFQDYLQINLSANTFNVLLDLWLDNFLARNYLIHLEHFLNIYGNIHRSTLFSSLRALNSLLISDNASFLVFYCLDQLFLKHEKNFPESFQNSNSLYFYQFKYLYQEERAFINSFFYRMNDFFSLLQSSVKNVHSLFREKTQIPSLCNLNDYRFYESQFEYYKDSFFKSITLWNKLLSNCKEYINYIIQSHFEYIGQLAKKYFSFFEKEDIKFQKLLQNIGSNGILQQDYDDFYKDISLCIKNLQCDCCKLLNCNYKQIPYPVYTETPGALAYFPFNQYDYINFNKPQATAFFENLIAPASENSIFSTDEFFNFLPEIAPSANRYADFTQAEICTAITEYIKKHPEYLTESTE